LFELVKLAKKKKSWWKNYRQGIIIVGGLLIGVPLIIYGKAYFTEILPHDPMLIVVTLVGTIVVGVGAEWFIKEAFRK
jgi:hypothetical protein